MGKEFSFSRGPAVTQLAGLGDEERSYAPASSGGSEDATERSE
jgi:hypothetical protein